MKEIVCFTLFMTFMTTAWHGLGTSYVISVQSAPYIASFSTSFDDDRK